MNLTIRDAREDDLLDLCYLMKLLTDYDIPVEEMRNRLEFAKNSPVDFFYVCEDNSIIQGAFGFRIRENLEENTRFGEISVIVVDEKARRKGIGRMMLDYAEQLAKEMSCIGTWLVSGFGREKDAHQFYMELGYQITGYRFVKKFTP